MAQHELSCIVHRRPFFSRPRRFFYRPSPRPFFSRPLPLLLSRPRPRPRPFFSRHRPRPYLKVGQGAAGVVDLKHERVAAVVQDHGRERVADVDGFHESLVLHKAPPRHEHATTAASVAARYKNALRACKGGPAYHSLVWRIGFEHEQTVISAQHLQKKMRNEPGLGNVKGTVPACARPGRTA